METLREAWRIAVPLHECQWLGPAAAALAEAAGLDGDDGAAVAELTEAYELAGRFGTAAVRAELAGPGGRPVGGNGLDHPYALLADGRWREAAETWRAAGCRYEYAGGPGRQPRDRRPTGCPRPARRAGSRTAGPAGQDTLEKPRCGSDPARSRTRDPGQRGPG
ncbi:hypothetical protein [Nonomuraea fuscirosea]|uniref:hypothetical protein n=1 Tax=Nonomuraea fuscirosea TaxID=1291556 RepID=UPI001C63A387|nr:hypothetical protein [Nonomuraea fuscirosea]